MGRARRDKLQFDAVLDTLHATTGRYEASFASKLVATLDTSKPVIDSTVLRNLGERLPYHGAKDRVARIKAIYADLCFVMTAFLPTETGRYLTAEFQRSHPKADITEIKMLDLVLWQTRDSRAKT